MGINYLQHKGSTTSDYKDDIAKAALKAAISTNNTQHGYLICTKDIVIIKFMKAVTNELKELGANLDKIEELNDLIEEMKEISVIKTKKD